MILFGIYRLLRAILLDLNLMICANPNKRNFDENSILLILNKVRAASFIHIG